MIDHSNSPTPTPKSEAKINEIAVEANITGMSPTPLLSAENFNASLRKQELGNEISEIEARDFDRARILGWETRWKSILPKASDIGRTDDKLITITQLVCDDLSAGEVYTKNALEIPDFYRKAVLKTLEEFLKPEGLTVLHFKHANIQIEAPKTKISNFLSRFGKAEPVGFWKPLIAIKVQHLNRESYRSQEMEEDWNARNYDAQRARDWERGIGLP